MAKATQLEFSYKGSRYRDAEKGLRALAQEFPKDFEENGSKALGRVMLKYLKGVSNALTKRHGGAWPSGTTPKTLSKRSGKGVGSIAKSIDIKHKNTIDSVTGYIGGKHYLRIHEYGGVIKAKNVRYLTIPLKAALNSNGTTKKKSARQWPNTFVAKSKKGNLIIFQKQGRGRIVPLYVLKEKVTIKPRLGMGDSLNALKEYFVDNAFSEMHKGIMSEYTRV